MGAGHSALHIGCWVGGLRDVSAETFCAADGGVLAMDGVGVGVRWEAARVATVRGYGRQYSFPDRSIR